MKKTTLKALTFILLLTMLVGVLPKKAEAASGQTIQGTVPTRTLKQGCKGNDVKWLQSALNAYGSYGLTVDGSFGAKTRSAVIAFQKAEKLTADGIFGPKSKAKLVKFVETLNNSVVEPPVSRPTLAKKILANKNITLWKRHSSGKKDNAYAYNNILDTANGKPASRSKYQGAPGGTVQLDPTLLKLILDLSAKYGKVTISEIAGGSHSKGSSHYKGIAIDVTYCGGKVSTAKGVEIYKYLTGLGYKLSTVKSGTVYENSSHYHIALKK